MNYTGPDAGIIKQWESKVHRWVSQGQLRDQILMAMTDANWTYTNADAFLKTVVTKQKRKWIIVLVVCGLFTILSIVGDVLIFMNGQGGNDAVFFPIVAGFCFVFSIVKLVKIRA